jgi:hypothetical protein
VRAAQLRAAFNVVLEAHGVAGCAPPHPAAATRPNARGAGGACGRRRVWTYRQHVSGSWQDGKAHSFHGRVARNTPGAPQVRLWAVVDISRLLRDGPGAGAAGAATAANMSVNPYTTVGSIAVDAISLPKVWMEKCQ